MPKFHASIKNQRLVTTLKEGMDPDSFDLSSGTVTYLRNSHKDPEDPDNEVYVVHGEDEYGPFHQARLLDLEVEGAPVFITTDEDLVDRLHVGKTVHPYGFDHIDDVTVQFTADGEPFFRASDGDQEKIVHGLWKSAPHDEVGAPWFHTTRREIVYAANDAGHGYLFCKDEEILEGFDHIWVSAVEEPMDGRTNPFIVEFTCGAVKGRGVFELKLTIEET